MLDISRSQENTVDHVAALSHSLASAFEEIDRTANSLNEHGQALARAVETLEAMISDFRLR